MDRDQQGALVARALQGLLAQAQPQAAPPQGLLASPRPPGGLLAGGAALPVPAGPQNLPMPAPQQQAHPKKPRDPNDYTFADYALGLISGGIVGPAVMALQQRQRHRAEASNRAGTEALFSDLGLNGQQQPPPRRPAMQGPGLDGLPVSPPDAGGPAPGRTNLSRASVLAALARARANGFDATPFMPMLGQMLDEQDVDGLVNTAPGPDRPLAKFDPKGYASYLLERRKPRSGENDTVEFDPATGKYETAYKARTKVDSGWEEDPVKPGSWRPVSGGPHDPAYIARTAGDRARSVREAAPPVSLIMPRGDGINSTGDVIGPIYSKIARGQQLTPGEQRLYDDRRAGDPLQALIAGFGGGQGYTAPRPPLPVAAPPAPGAPPRRGPSKQARQPAPVRQQNGVYMPTSAADMASVPKGAKFLNPANGQVLTKAR